jgi:hypothetical protein
MLTGIIEQSTGKKVVFNYCIRKREAHTEFQSNRQRSKYSGAIYEDELSKNE